VRSVTGFGRGESLGTGQPQECSIDIYVCVDKFLVSHNGGLMMDYEEMKPDPKLLEIAEEILKQNKKILEMNHSILKPIIYPRIKVTTEG
jgi:hypothetical protein